MFVCLFVEIIPEKLYSASCGRREVNLLGVITHGQGTNHVRTKDSGTCHVLVTFYKLTGWLASLDLAAPTQQLILSHRTASPHALFDVLGLDGGRGKTMSDLVDSDRELPVNLAKINTAKLHTETHMRTYTKVQSKTKQNKKNVYLTDDDCFYYHSWRNNIVIAFGTLSSFLA